jgi:hypothetical protein
MQLARNGPGRREGLEVYQRMKNAVTQAGIRAMSDVLFLYISSIIDETWSNSSFECVQYLALAAPLGLAV